MKLNQPWYVPRGEKKRKKKVKIKTQNDKLVETDRDIWHWTYEKTVIRIRKKQCNVSSRMNYLEFAFKGPKYARNLVFLLIFCQSFWNIKKTEGLFFLHLIFLESLESQWSVPASEIGLYLVLSELFEEKYCTLVKRLIFWGVTQKYELQVSFKAKTAL